MTEISLLCIEFHVLMLYYLLFSTPAAASNSPWDGVVPATPTPNPEHVGYWVARVGWVQGDKISGRDESAEQCTDRWNEGCVSPPPQYEGCVSPPPQYEEL